MASAKLKEHTTVSAGPPDQLTYPDQRLDPIATATSRCKFVAICIAITSSVLAIYLAISYSYPCQLLNFAII